MSTDTTHLDISAVYPEATFAAKYVMQRIALFAHSALGSQQVFGTKQYVTLAESNLIWLAMYPQQAGVRIYVRKGYGKYGERLKELLARFDIQLTIKSGEPALSEMTLTFQLRPEQVDLPVVQGVILQAWAHR